MVIFQEGEAKVHKQKMETGRSSRLWNFYRDVWNPIIICGFNFVMSVGRAFSKPEWIQKVFLCNRLAKLCPILSNLLILDIRPTKQNSETWDYYLDWNLPVSKSLVSFCSTGIGHVLEQENKSMKIQSRTKGAGNNESALEEHFLISYDWSQITKLFLESFVWIPPK